MIARYWRGLTESRYANIYIEHLRRDTLSQLTTLPGFVSASIRRREMEGGTEFLVVTVWESLEAIEQFAGPDVERAVVPEKARSLMIEYDARARHYEVVA